MCFSHDVTWMVCLWCVPSVMCVNESAMHAVCCASEWTMCAICCSWVSRQYVSSVACKWMDHVCQVLWVDGVCCLSCVSEWTMYAMCCVCQWVDFLCGLLCVLLSGHCMPCVVYVSVSVKPVSVEKHYNNNNNLFSIPTIHQSGYRTCQYIIT
jgi:hypothetical protein